MVDTSTMSMLANGTPFATGQWTKNAGTLNDDSFKPIVFALRVARAEPEGEANGQKR